MIKFNYTYHNNLSLSIILIIIKDISVISLTPISYLVDSYIFMQ